MNKFLLLTFLISLTLQNSFCQQNYIPLHSFSPTDTNFSDLKQLDPYFQNKTIIGMGESTHGTSEFTTMRHRVFKYLVEYHQFNTFFLEADFGVCQRINRFVHGENDTAMAVVKNIKLWPFMTEEIVKLIEWMREYNSTHQNKISFVGSDMQYINDDILEIQRLLPNQIEILSQLDSMKEPTNFYYTKNVNFRIKNYKIWQELKSQIDTNQFSSEDKLNYLFYKNGINQFFEYYDDKSIFQNHRDSCMGTNIYLYEKSHPNTKGIYFAHNGHAQKWNIKIKNSGFNKKAGRYLYEYYGENYFCISLDFYEGFVTAVNLKTHQIESFYSVSNDKNSIGYYLNQFNEPILFCTINSIPDIENKKIRTIGAVFEKKERERYHLMYYGKLNTEVFDAILFIQKTNPTKVLISKASKF